MGFLYIIIYIGLFVRVDIEEVRVAVYHILYSLDSPSKLLDEVFELLLIFMNRVAQERTAVVSMRSLSMNYASSARSAMSWRYCLPSKLILSHAS